MSVPPILSLGSDIWAEKPEDRLGGLQELEIYRANQEGRTPCRVHARDLDPRIYGMHYSDGNVEHIDLNSSIVNESEPYQAVETLLHESEHAYQQHVVQNPELAKYKMQLKDWTISEYGGYVGPEDGLLSDYRWQPTEVDAREAARLRTDELYQGSMGNTEDYASYKAFQEQQFADAIESARSEYRLSEKLSEAEALAAIKEEARQSMVAKYEGHMYGQQSSDRSERVPPTSRNDVPHQPTTEEIGRSVGGVVGAASGVPQGAKIGETVAASADEAQSFDHIQDMASANIIDQPHEPTTEEIGKATGEAAGAAAGVPAGGEVGEVVGSAAGEAQAAVNESIGQSTEAPINDLRRTDSEAPRTEASADDQEYYRGYGH